MAAMAMLLTRRTSPAFSRMHRQKKAARTLSTARSVGDGMFCYYHIQSTASLSLYSPYTPVPHLTHTHTLWGHQCSLASRWCLGGWTGDGGGPGALLSG